MNKSIKISEYRKGSRYKNVIKNHVTVILAYRCSIFGTSLKIPALMVFILFPVKYLREKRKKSV